MNSRNSGAKNMEIKKKKLVEMNFCDKESDKDYFSTNTIVDIKSSRNIATRITRELIFPTNQEDNLWELFIKNFLIFKHYPSDSELEEETRSIFEIIRIFEQWKTHIYPFKISLLDFCKAIERFSLHPEAHNYRMNAIVRYKHKLREIKRTNEEDDQTGFIHCINHKEFDLSKSTSSSFRSISDSFLHGNSIKNQLKLKREIALNRRKNLINMKQNSEVT